MPSKSNIRKVNGKPIKLGIMTDTRYDVNLCKSKRLIDKLDTKWDEDNVVMSQKEQASFATTEAEFVQLQRFFV